MNRWRLSLVIHGYHTEAERWQGPKHQSNFTSRYGRQVDDDAFADHEQGRSEYAVPKKELLRR